MVKQITVPAEIKDVCKHMLKVVGNKQAEMLLAFQDFLAKGFQESEADAQTTPKVGRPRLNPKVFENLPKL